jgi:hypothetical protein
MDSSRTKKNNIMPWIFRILVIICRGGTVGSVRTRSEHLPDRIWNESRIVFNSFIITATYHSISFAVMNVLITIIMIFIMLAVGEGGTLIISFYCLISTNDLVFNDWNSCDEVNHKSKSKSQVICRTTSLTQNEVGNVLCENCIPSLQQNHKLLTEKQVIRWNIRKYSSPCDMCFEKQQ